METNNVFSQPAPSEESSPEDDRQQIRDGSRSATAGRSWKQVPTESSARDDREKIRDGLLESLFGKQTGRPWKPQEASSGSNIRDQTRNGLLSSARSGKGDVPWKSSTAEGRPVYNRDQAREGHLRPNSPK